MAVAALAQRYCTAIGLDKQQSEYCVAAGLLHDIGHAPLSHSLESGFKSKFEIDHHRSGEAIIRGDVKIGKELAHILVEGGLNNMRVLSIIDGHDDKVFNEIFSHAINIDTIEAILRCRSYLYRSDLDITAPKVLSALVRRDRKATEVLDQFWRLKNEVYSRLIQSRVGISADYICKRYMEVNSENFKESYYFGTEEELRNDHRALFEILALYGKTKLIPDELAPPNGVVDWVMRSFTIDSEVELSNIYSIDRRYLQKKEIKSFNARRVGDGILFDAEPRESDQLFQ